MTDVLQSDDKKYTRIDPSKPRPRALWPTRRLAVADLRGSASKGKEGREKKGEGGKDATGIGPPTA